MNGPLQIAQQTITSVLISLTLTGLMYAQTADHPSERDPSSNSPGASPITSAPANSAPAANAAESAMRSTSSISPSTNRTESSLFYFLNMAGKNPADFRPPTPKEKAKFYAKGLFSPIMLVTASTSAAIAQSQNVPPSWGQGAEGFGARFGNYFAKQAVQRTLRLGGEVLLHEDNRYYSSGAHGAGRRIAYALKSSITARGADGKQHFSFSEVGSLAGSSFISRLWQPSTNNSASDGLTSFGIALAGNAGTDVLREFLPDLTRRIFRRH